MHFIHRFAYSLILAGGLASGGCATDSLPPGPAQDGGPCSTCAEPPGAKVFLDGFSQDLYAGHRSSDDLGQRFQLVWLSGEGMGAPADPCGYDTSRGAVLIYLPFNGPEGSTGFDITGPTSAIEPDEIDGFPHDAEAHLSFKLGSTITRAVAGHVDATIVSRGFVTDVSTQTYSSIAIRLTGTFSATLEDGRALTGSFDSWSCIPAACTTSPENSPYEPCDFESDY